MFSLLWFTQKLLKGSKRICAGWDPSLSGVRYDLSFWGRTENCCKSRAGIDPMLYAPIWQKHELGSRPVLNTVWPGNQHWCHWCGTILLQVTEETHPEIRRERWDHSIFCSKQRADAVKYEHCCGIAMTWQYYIHSVLCRWITYLVFYILCCMCVWE